MAASDRAELPTAVMICKNDPSAACPIRARWSGSSRRLTVTLGRSKGPSICSSADQARRLNDLLSSWSQVRSLPGARPESAAQAGRVSVLNDHRTRLPRRPQPPRRAQGVTSLPRAATIASVTRPLVGVWRLRCHPSGGLPGHGKEGSACESDEEPAWPPGRGRDSARAVPGLVLYVLLARGPPGNLTDRRGVGETQHGCRHQPEDHVGPAAVGQLAAGCVWWRRGC